MNTMKFLILFLILTSCDAFTEIDPPASELVRTTVFNDNETASRAVLGIYSTLSSDLNFASGGIESFSFIAALSADDLLPASASYAAILDQFSRNEILPANEFVTDLWSKPYEAIYRANSIIEGLANSTGVSGDLRDQLIGEAKFIRAFCHFYLVNFWGDVPLVLSTDYQINSHLDKTPASEIYDQIITDLKDAQIRLNEKYVRTDGFSYVTGVTPLRVRPNKAVATSLLARVYLFRKEWKNAETEASRVIGNSEYSLEPLDKVFLKESREAIWQLSQDDQNSPEGRLYMEPDKNGVLTSSLMSSFQPDDARQTAWIGTFSDGSKHPAKYRATVTIPITEYSIIFRLAEQYLIRAEARANLENLSGAETDLNAIRTRAGLTGITGTTGKDLLLSVIYQERRLELFTEWGHRWLDLKRTNRINDIMELEKTSTWDSTAVLYPIPQAQINKSVVRQNPGYF